MSRDHFSQPHLIDVSYSTQEMKQLAVATLVKMKETSPGVSVAEFDDSCHVTVNATLELPIVSEIIADYWSSQGFVVTRYMGAHDDPQEVKTFLTASMKHRYVQGKYTYPYGTVKSDEESESES